MNTKKVLLFIVIILILIVGGLAILYYKTDLLKTDRQKFWKYVNTNSEIVELYNNEDFQSIKNRRSNSPYEVNSNLIVNKDDDSYVITANTTAKNSNDIMTYVDFQYNNKSIVNFNLIKESNLIGLKMDELANGYIAIKNNDIKKLASDAGIESIENMPNNINWFSILDFLYVSQSDEKYFTETYSNLIFKNTSKENYSKEESGVKIDDKMHVTTGYKLKLNQTQFKEVTKAILEHVAKDDSRALNFISSKLKLLNLPSKYTDISAISENITKTIQYIDTIETNDKNFIEIIVYVEEGKVLQTNIKLEDDSTIKVIIDRANRKVKIEQNKANKKLLKSANKLAQYIANIQEINASTEVSEDKNSVIVKFDAKFYNNLSIECNSRSAIVESVEENTDFVDSKKLVLNELESDKLKGICNVLKTNIPTLYKKKVEMLKNNTEENSEQPEQGTIN